MSAFNSSDSRGIIARATLLATGPAIVATALAASGLFVDDVTKALYAGAGTLIFGGLLGGMLKLLLDDVALKRARRADAATFVGNVLQDLKSVHDRVARARILIMAHQSAKTYGEEMRDLIDSQVQLTNVKRALERRADGIRDATLHDVTGDVEAMRSYLRDLTSEFVRDYKPIADLQRLHEKRVSVAVEEAARHGSASSAVTLPNEPWHALLKLERLRDFVQSAETYERGFGVPLDAASAVLRRELAWIQGATWQSLSSDGMQPSNPADHDAGDGVIAGVVAASIGRQRATVAGRQHQ